MMRRLRTPLGNYNVMFAKLAYIFNFMRRALPTWHDASYDVARCKWLRLACQKAPADQLTFIVLWLIPKGRQDTLHQGPSFSLVEEGGRAFIF